MKFLLILLLSIVASITYAQRFVISIDYRLTALSNAAIDIEQTYRFLKDGKEEKNPLFASFANNNDPGLVRLTSYAGVLLLDYLIQEQPKNKRNTYYAIWSVAHIWAIRENNKRGYSGTPIVVPLLQVKF